MDTTIRFLLNGEAVEIADLPPMTTLLNWLRYERRLTGTKEGCAEGDCGACTVGLRRVGTGGLETRPVCACIMTLGMVHGSEIVTVEGLASPCGRLHPVQQALAEGHGSQCGFCTPGFVMSLWCAWSTEARPDAQRAAELLQGNLCRCTGYGPILEAAAAAYDLPAPNWQRTDGETVAAIAALGTSGGLAYEAAGRRFFAPETVEELTRLVSLHPEATILAGATDVGLWVTKQAFDPACVIHVDRVSALHDMREAAGHLWIGAAATYAQAAPLLAAHWPEFGALIARIGGGQVRAAGTIGGNIANGSPVGDMAPALIAAGALLVLRSATGRREMPLETFFRAYGDQALRSGEIVEAVRVPLPEAGVRLACYKLSKRQDQDISSVLGCFDVRATDGRVTAARLAFGGMAGIPARAAKAEAALHGEPWRRATIDAAMTALADDFSPIDDHRASGAYRLRAAQNLLLRYFLEHSDEPACRGAAVPG